MSNACLAREERETPVVERAMTLGGGVALGMVQMKLSRVWVERFAGDMVRPFVMLNFGVPAG